VVVAYPVRKRQKPDRAKNFDPLEDIVTHKNCGFSAPTNTGVLVTCLAGATYAVI